MKKLLLIILLFFALYKIILFFNSIKLLQHTNKYFIYTVKITYKNGDNDTVIIKDTSEPFLHDGGWIYKNGVDDSMDTYSHIRKIDILDISK